MKKRGWEDPYSVLHKGLWIFARITVRISTALMKTVQSICLQLLYRDPREAGSNGSRRVVLQVNCLVADCMNAAHFRDGVFETIERRDRCRKLPLRTGSM